MKFLMTGLCGLCLWATAVLPVSAGWDNVFQPTLFHRKPVSTSQYYVAPAVVAQYQPAVVAQYQPVVVAQSAPCDTCEQKKCTTNYVQRSYYQPVTTYETKSVAEQVTTMQTSYYYEPVTSYRYSSYYNPGTCCYQQVAVPQTSYELRSKQCPVQSWVSRCVQVPVQGYQKVDYWQPQTTCCSTTMGAPVMTAPAMAAPAMTAPPVMAAPPLANPVPNMAPVPVPTEQPPSISGTRTPGAGMSKPTMWEQYYPPIDRTPEIRNTPGTSFRPQLGVPVPVQTNSPPAPGAAPPVRLDRIAVGPNSHIDGQVVRSDNSPKPNAKVLFINASTGMRHTVNANTAGRFHAELPAGSWHLYLHGADDLPIYQSRVDVNGAQTRQVNLVSRSN